MASSRPTSSWVRSHLANPTLRAALRSPAHRALSGSLLLLDYTSRRSGRRCVFPVQYAVCGEALVVVAGQHRAKTWWRHFDDHPQQVIAHLRGRATTVTVRRLIAGTDERTQAAASYTKRFPHTEVPPDSPVLLLVPHNREP
ncbi:hypothetical protein [Lapillicoccus sp.]|uniref:hypothetical protein n=1 Tax=Lapillicoccus sp. TaxID=1909287 RepID=UPI00326416DD